MTLSLINNLESLGIVRGKINDTITETDKSIIKTSDFVAGPDLTSGNVTSQTANSITNSGAAWTVNQYVGYGVKLTTATGEIDYAIVLSNTDKQLTFDTNHAGYTFTSYRILSTFEISTINSINSIDIEANDCAILLPDLLSVENRKFIKVYVEKSLNNGKRAAIICRGTQKQRGFKWGFLNYKYEGVEFWSHLTATIHWDILALENIKRYTSASLNANIAITSATFTNILDFAKVNLGTTRRFEMKNISGIAWFKYMSITPLTMSVKSAIKIRRTGGGGSSLVEVALRIKKFNGGAIVDTPSTVIDLTGDDYQNVPALLAIDLDPYDEVTIIAKRDAGTIALLAGSDILIEEV